MGKPYPGYEHDCNRKLEEHNNTGVNTYSISLQFEVHKSISPYCGVIIIVISSNLDIKLQEPVE